MTAAPGQSSRHPAVIPAKAGIQHQPELDPQPSSADSLAGSYQLRPGQRHSISGQRPVLAAGRLGTILRGMKGVEVGEALASLFTLCAHAHVRTSRMALAAAAGREEHAAEDGGRLLLDTARDHLRTIALDWPRLLGGPAYAAASLQWLRGCPLPLANTRAWQDASLAALSEWLEHEVLGETCADWLVRCREKDALAHWCSTRAERLAAARCLSECYPLADTLRPPARCLAVLGGGPERQQTQLRALADAIATDPVFVQRPTWLGECAENGPWSRLRYTAERPPLAYSAWTRLASRWLELVEIGAFRADTPGSVPLLASGALALEPGQALAWCEMGRGLLFHWVRVDAQGAVEDYRVLAPTEWNFHPQGALAGAVERLGATDTAAAHLLAAAFDPCVPCSVVAAA